MRIRRIILEALAFLVTTAVLAGTLRAGADESTPAVLPPFEDRPFNGAQPYIYNGKQFHGRFKGTGPFRRTAILGSYSGIVGTVSLPCRAAKLRPATDGGVGEIGFAYVGGWGAGDIARAVDAGFQKSSVNDGKEDDNYSLIMFYQGAKWRSEFPRLRCGQDVRFDFRPISRTELKLTAWGTGKDGQPANPSITVSTQDQDGWWPEGDPTADEKHGIILKRMTTIAQTKDVVKTPDWDRSGSFFGHYPNDATPRVVWKKMFVGRQDGSKWAWVPWDSADAERVQDSWPDASRAQSVVKNQEEATAIDLRSAP